MTKYPAKMPKPGSFLMKLARFLAGNSPKCNGLVPLASFYQDHPTASRDDVIGAMSDLRVRFKYFCRMSDVRHNHVECALEWPTTTRTVVWKDSKDWELVDAPAIGDPRLHEPKIKWKFTRLKPNTVIATFAVWALRNRDGCFGVDLSPMFARFGYRRCRNMMNSLEKKYGFTFEKLTTNYDAYYRITRERNRKLMDDERIKPVKKERPPEKHPSEEWGGNL